MSYSTSGEGEQYRWFAVDGAGKVLLVAPLDYERRQQVRRGEGAVTGTSGLYERWRQVRGILLLALLAYETLSLGKTIRSISRSTVALPRITKIHLI